eukprot:gene12128-biopygen25850
MFGSTVHQVAPSNELRLRRAVVRAVWGRAHRKRCPELVLTLAAHGHRVDPVQAAAFQRIMMLRRMLERRPDLGGALRRAWEASRKEAGYVPGPVGRLRESLRRLGWQWPEPGRLVPDDGRPPLDLAEVEPGRLAHEVREAARGAEWRARVLPYELGIMRTLICGGTWTHDRLE